MSENLQLDGLTDQQTTTTIKPLHKHGKKLQMSFEILSNLLKFQVKYLYSHCLHIQIVDSWFQILPSNPSTVPYLSHHHDLQHHKNL